MRRTVIGRDGERDAVARMLDGLGEGSATLVFEGEPGIGKTTLLRMAQETARARGVHVLSCAAAASETSMAYAALGDALAEVDDARIDALAGQQREALRVALLRAEAGEAPADPRAVAAATLGVLAALAEDGPVVWVVDDVQWLDRPSARVLEFCQRRLPVGAGVLAARRPGELGAALDVRDPARGLLRRVDPLDRAATEQLLRERAPRALDRAQIARVSELADGNPFYALELARSVRAGQTTLPPSLEELVAARLDGLSPGAGDALLAAALLADPTVELLADALGPDAPHRLEEAEERAIVERHGRRVRFAHPLLAHAVAARASAPARRAMHRRLSDAVRDPEQRARHLAAGGVLPAALPALEHAARVTSARGAPAAAAELLELALELGAGDEVRQRAAEHHVFAGDLARAQALLERTVAEGRPGPLRGRALLLLSEIRYRDDGFAEAHALLDRAAEEADGDDLLLAMIGLRRTFTLFNLGRGPEAHAAVHATLAIAERCGDDGVLAQVLALVAIMDFAAGLGFDEPRLRRALALEDPGLGLADERRPLLISMFLLSWVGRLEEAVAQTRTLVDVCVDHGREHDLAWLTSRLVWIECWRGELAAAERAAEEAERRLFGLETANGRMLALTGRAQVDALRGRADDARRVAEEALALVAQTSWKGAAAWQRVTLGFVELSVGDAEAAIGWLEPLVEAAMAAGMPEPAVDGVLFQGDAAEALIATGRIEEARALIDLLEQRGAQLDRIWAIAVGGRCRGLLLNADGDPVAAEQAIERALLAHERLPMPVERGRTLLALGRVRRRLRRRRAASDAIEEAERLFAAAGAALWVRQAREERDSLGLSRGDGDELTPSEERIARLAASGLTNRAVADALIISPKTVEAHLARAYRKLGIRSRAELGARMARLDDDGGAGG